MLMHVSNDIQAQYGAMLGHMPHQSYQHFGHGSFMVQPQEGSNNMWSMTAPLTDPNATEMPPYLGPKNQQVVSCLCSAFIYHSVSIV